MHRELIHARIRSYLQLKEVSISYSVNFGGMLCMRGYNLAMILPGETGRIKGARLPSPGRKLTHCGSTCFSSSGVLLAELKTTCPIAVAQKTATHNTNNTAAACLIVASNFRYNEKEKPGK